MPAVARIGDPYDCGDAQSEGSGDVFTNNIPTSRLGDMTLGHTPAGHTFFPAVPVAEGSGSVFVNNVPIARLGDAHLGHCDSPHSSSHCHGGVFSSASGDVFAG